MNGMCLAHYGTKGQIWGERKYQNADGSLTTLGRIHYGIKSHREKQLTTLAKKSKKVSEELNSSSLQTRRSAAKAAADANNARYMDKVDKYRSSQSRADRSFIFKGIKQQAADRDYQKMKKEVTRKSKSDKAYASIEAQISKLEYRQIKLDNKLKSKTQKYIDKYGEYAYKEFSNRQKRASFLTEQGTLNDEGKAHYGISSGSKQKWDRSYMKLHNDGYRPSEIAKILGQSTKDTGKPSGEFKKYREKYKLNKADMEHFRARQNRARSLKSSGKTIAEIADMMGEPVPNVKDYLYEDMS